MKKCELCKRWTKPTKSAACYMPEYYDPILLDNLVDWVRNEDGTYYCSEFKPKTKPR